MKAHYIVLFLLAALLVGCTVRNDTTILPTQNTGYTGTGDSTHGRVVVLVHDAAAGTVTSMKATIDSVEVYNTNTGWVPVGADKDTYDLLQLQGTNKVVADRILEAGVYTQMRIKISSIIVTDANGDHDAIIPSDKMVITANTVVKPNSVAVIDVDFVAGDSLHLTADGQYVITPVLHIQTFQDATVNVNNRVAAVSGGTLVSDALVSQDVRGVVATGIQVPRTVDVIVVGGQVQTTTSSPQPVVINNYYSSNTTYTNTTNTYTTNTVYTGGSSTNNTNSSNVTA